LYEAISSNKWKSGLMLAVFVVFVVGVGYVIGLALGGTAHPEYAWIGLAIAFVIAVVMGFSSYYSSDKLALSTSGARPVEEFMSDENWRPLAIRFDNAVEGLAIAAGLPKPKAYIIPDQAPNAFATGRNPEKSSIAATAGLLQMMNDQELQGVVAHEMSHVKNYDILIMTMTIVLVGTVILISDIFLRTFWFAGDDSDSGEAGLVFLVIGIVLAIVAPIVATFIKFWIGRKREYLADANGALLTRYPPGLASALRKISDDPKQMRRANKATAHMYIMQPLKTEKGAKGGCMNRMFDTHPPVEDRIARLEALAPQFQEVQVDGSVAPPPASTVPPQAAPPDAAPPGATGWK
jgi:heat shock protein HtpX